MSIARRRIVAIATAAVLLPSLSGCWAGFGAQTSQQANQAIGNGANMSTGDIEIRGATWVRNTANPAEATLTATFVNNGDVPDKLVKVEIEPPSPMGITGGELEVPVVGSLRTGFFSPNFINAFSVQAFPSTFVTTTFTFENAGTVTGDVITTPNTGQYAGVAVSLAEQQRLQELVAQTNPAEDATTTEKVAKAKKKKEAQASDE